MAEKRNRKGKKKARRVYAFIDSQNLNLGTGNDVYRQKKKVYSGWKLDFKRFRVYLKEKYGVEKAFLFIGLMPGNEGLYRDLKSWGYVLVYKPTLEIRRGGEKTVKGNVDAELVLQAMDEYDNYDQAVIVSGDGDFHCLVEYLAKRDKLCRVLVPNQRSYSSLLAKFRKQTDFISPLKAKLEFKGPKPNKKA